ncbi:MAG: MBL fold metallo-hydrolase [Clostridia bacterium]|nr:MBL fold metallo-hydrolase [Clostridia bacterium]
MVINVLQVGMLMTNCYIAMDEATKEAIVVDPGAREDKILAAIKDMGADVKYIVFTHSHYDHIMAAHEVWKATGAKIAVHKDDAYLLKKEEVTKFGKFTTAKYVEVTPDVLLEDGDKIQVGNLTFDVLNTPGHSNGSICLVCEDVIFAGDTLFKGTCGRCDLVNGDLNKMYVSLKKIAELKGDYRVLPGHESPTTLEYERHSNEYMMEAMKR